MCVCVRERERERESTRRLVDGSVGRRLCVCVWFSPLCVYVCVVLSLVRVCALSLHPYLALLRRGARDGRHDERLHARTGVVALLCVCVCVLYKGKPLCVL